MPVENLCAPVRQLRFSPDSERVRLAHRGHAETPHVGRAAVTTGPLNKPRLSIQAGYHSTVCSNTGDAIDRIRAAIDQLARDARDARGEASESELTARVAALWQMVSELDPELARRAQRYTGPVGGGPSA